MSVTFPGLADNYLSRTGNLLSTDNAVPFSWVMWVKHDLAGIDHGHMSYFWDGDPATKTASTLSWRIASNLSYVGVTGNNNTSYTKNRTMTSSGAWFMYGLSRVGGPANTATNNIFASPADGFLNSTTTARNPHDPGPAVLRVGYGVDFSSNAKWLDGKVAHLCFWEGVVLSEAEFTTLWNNGTGTNPEDVQGGSIVEHWHFRDGSLTGINGNVLTATGSVGTDAGDNPAFSYSSEDTISVYLTAEGSSKEVIQNAAGEQTGLWEYTTNTAAAGDQLEAPNQTTGGVTAALQSDGHVNYSGVPGPGPNFTSPPSVSSKSSGTITVQCPVNQSCTVYGVAVPAGTQGNLTNPDAADNVRAGLAPDGTAPTASASTVGGGAVDVTFGGLTASTAYDWYVTPSLQAGDTLPGVREYDDSGAADAKWQNPADQTIEWYETGSYTPPSGTETTEAPGPVPPTFTGNIADQTDAKGDVINLDVSTQFDEGNGTGVSYTSIGTPLPDDLSLSTAGVITGTLTKVAVTTGHVIRLDTSNGFAPSNTFSWTVNPAPQAPAFGGPIPDPQTVYQDVAFSRDYSTYFLYQETAPPVSYALAAGSAALPTGLTLNTTTGVISGTVATLGDTTGVILECTNAIDTTPSNSFTFSVVVQPAIDPDDTWSGWQKVEDDRWEATNLNTGAVIEIVRKAQPLLLPSGSYERYEGYVDTVLQNPTEEWPRKSWHGMQSYLKQTGWYP